MERGKWYVLKENPIPKELFEMILVQTNTYGLYLLSVDNGKIDVPKEWEWIKPIGYMLIPKDIEGARKMEKYYIQSI